MTPTEPTEESKQAGSGENRAGERPRGRFWRVLGHQCLIFLVCLLLLAGLLGGGLYLFAPVILETTAPPIARVFGVQNLSFNVKKLSFSEAELTKIHLGDGVDQGITIDQLHIRRSRKHGQADSITVSGLTINWTARDGEMFIPGIVQRQARPGQSPSIATLIRESSRFPEKLARLDFPMTITINRSAVTVKQVFPDETRKVVLPFEARVFLEKPGAGIVTFQGKGGPGDGPLPFLPAEISCGSWTYSLTGVFSPEKRGIKADVSCDLTDIAYRRENKAVSIPRVTLAGRVTEGGTRALDGSVSIACPAADAHGGGMRLQGISFHLPLKFQLTDKLVFTGAPGKGGLNIAAVSRDRRLLGAVAADIVQTAETLSIAGRFIPDAEKKAPPVQISASMTLPGGHDYRGPSWRADLAWQPEKIDCGTFIPAMQGMIMSGSVKIAAVATAVEKGAGTKALELTVSDARIEYAGTKTILEGLNISFAVPDLRTLRSAPAQTLHFHSLTYGNIALGSGDIRFQLEPGNVLFVEAGTLKWCDGNLDLGAMRVAPAQFNTIGFTAFCDRLKIAELLRQLKVAEASGDGRVGGRLPILLSKGRVEINEGFLYSTPGEGGRIQLKKCAATGLEDTIQMAITREALKDYQYNWLRMALNTRGNQLKINLKMDGAPTGKLAFTYDEKAALKKAGAGDPGAFFQGISFDITFTIPTQEVFELGSQAAKIF